MDIHQQYEVLLLLPDILESVSYITANLGGTPAPEQEDEEQPGDHKASTHLSADILDNDGDGHLSQQEFAQIDINGDGVIENAELQRRAVFKSSLKLVRGLRHMLQTTFRTLVGEPCPKLPLELLKFLYTAHQLPKAKVPKIDSQILRQIESVVGWFNRAAIALVGQGTKRFVVEQIELLCELRPITEQMVSDCIERIGFHEIKLGIRLDEHAVGLHMQDLNES